MIQLTEQQKLIAGGIGVFTLLVIVALIFGAFFDFCDARKIKKQEANISTKSETVDEGEKTVNETKQEAAETKGEVKVLKEVIKKNDKEVNEKTIERRKATRRRDRIRRNPLRNVNGTDLNRILDEADRKQ